ncbi:DUF4326 domain-containing protein [Verrucosispora sp. WMMD1129]|uniref:DUF4326 domain-containing protein n=1 Tax=Verrucosispora sp. WMMD1129 TaxID=3016093 RepID=UPI00249C6602|nr:DUF4326 domain-containing protein [Verrucosispora sp. WMMD1129]WFE44276.1 DUF4326 domain-containing protein [Verrucosispora sp. WMMD1129]
MNAPQRVKATRRAGQTTVPAGAVYVGRAGYGLRGSPYANPHRVGKPCRVPDCGGTTHNLTESLSLYRHQVLPGLADAARADLAGRDLACWCKPEQPCHVDDLIAVANRKEPTVTVNLDVVELILDCANLTPEAFTNRELCHRDGRPFSDAEHDLVSRATMAELQAARDHSAKLAEHAREQHALADELATLTRPYFDRFGDGATLGDLRPLMTPDDRGRFDDIVSRMSAL